ncbi:MAG: hypothetical protein U1F29_15795 [Planctomycetota bacterium]
MIRTVGILLVLAAALACSAPRKESRGTEAPSLGSKPAVVKPWTDAFQKPTLVLADEIVIEGPDGLIEHVATRADLEVQTKRERTTAQGFLTEIGLKPGVAPVEIRAFLDRYELVAMKKLTVLERPGPVDVLLRADGDVFVRDGASGAEERPATLRIQGKIQR